MELIPKLEIGWLNGWILLALEFSIQGFLLLVFPKDVVSRLFDRSGWNKKQRGFTIIGKVFSLACLILIFLTPLKTNSSAFIVGLILYAIGLAGLVAAMLNFKDTPLNQPVTKGGLQDITPPPDSGTIYPILGNMCSDRLMAGFIRVNFIQVVSAFWNPGRGRGMLETIW